MNPTIRSKIIGTGCYIPAHRVKNEDFLDNDFYDSDGKPLEKSNEENIQKFEQITTIKERRYVTEDLLTSDIGYFAALEAIKNAEIDPESLDYIIAAHNFGDVSVLNKNSNFVPSIASRIKYNLGIENPSTIPQDLPFGCPGWLQGVINADYYLKSGEVNRIMVIGADTLSKVADPHDRDSMLYADGAGAVILEARESKSPSGIIAHHTRSDTRDFAYMLWMGQSNNHVDNGDQSLYLKMEGHKLYQYTLKVVPSVVKECLSKASVKVQDIKKVLLHQANGKMDEAILKRVLQQSGIEEIPNNLMPMTISWLGNSSVATLPTLLDMLFRGKLKDHNIEKKDHLLLASVGAGMNVNALVYCL